MQSKLVRLLDPLYRWITNYMGNCGFILYNLGKEDAPAVPPYEKLAKMTQQSNLDMARMGLSANRVNQETPFGSLQYSQTGTDQWGNPTYTATQKLSPEQQALYEKQTGLQSGVLGAAQAGLGNVLNSVMQGGVDQSKLAQTGINPGETYSDAIMRRLQPQMQMAKQSFESQMANQGISPNSEAYQNARRQFDQQQNDQLTSAITGGMDVGLRANQQGYNQAQSNLNMPINFLNSLRTGNNLTNPNYVNAANMANVPGVDYSGAGNNQYNAQLAETNANNAGMMNFTNGLFSLGSSYLGRK